MHEFNTGTYFYASNVMEMNFYSLNYQSWTGRSMWHARGH